jgi:AraC-like DNA-binding protein
MLRAGEMLIHSRDPVSTSALTLGYESENAFSFAFKREMGRSPRQFSREQASGLARPVSACFSTFR